MYTDQWLATGRQPGACSRALLGSFQPGKPIGTVDQATTPKPRLGNPEPKNGDPKPRLRAPRLGTTSLGLGTPSLGLGTPSLGLANQA